MLELKHLKKYYKVGETTTKALDDVSVSFRNQEFVAILGPSGSGKTTMLNMIGGLDRYDSGNLVIEGKSTDDFKDSDWDAYRNNSVGFIFQSYNIIGHLSIIDNVEMGMTLSGVSGEEKKRRAKDALIRVGLEKHMNKRPNQLSGGQMQRVAIARAIANDPEILLADEPTGALDSETSDEIMQLIKELSKERLVVMVTHNPELARQYADRIIEFADGKIQTDSNPYNGHDEVTNFKLKHTKMSYWTALKLSFKNIMTKKGRTFLTVFASSIGIISIAIVLALSNGFQKQIDQTQSDTMASMPVSIGAVASDSSAAMTDSQNSSFSKHKYVEADLSKSDKAQHVNKIDSKYLDYVKKMPKKYTKNIAVTYSTGMNLISQKDGKWQTVKFSNADPDAKTVDTSSMMASVTGVGGSVYPIDRDGNQSFLKKNYHVLSGSYPKKATDVVLIADRDNKISISALKNFGITAKTNQKFDYNQLIGKTAKLVTNNTYYKKLPTGNYVPSDRYASMANAKDTKTLKVVGILRVKSKNSDGLLSNGIAYSDQLTKSVYEDNKDSDIVKAQAASKKNIMTGETMDASTKNQMLTMLGGSETPSTIQIYPSNFKKKDRVLDYLDKYNDGKKKADQIVYTDMAGSISKLTGGMMDAITYVLVAFTGISLVTSMIMIAIITYTSVIERTKEIGVLKALGARKKDITRVFDAETAILGIGSGLFGIVVAWLCTFPINVVLEKMTGLSGVSQLNPVHAILLVIVSAVLTILGGHIPARMAAKKDAAIALRTE
ncbi:MULTISPECIES: ATP-binding cassette domain-containing protein [Pediococcus]|uniref:ABC transporter ATP-binding protein/permease n=1 Tax=Pediococcus TaxID=1253 RepID=UPI001361F5B6|nr:MULTISPECIES: ABC transporter ATP-binding protein/permease [Pediococcus]KAF5440020.1 ATP-binding cassette domain-containing protein [Pediococcus sp. EKM202D]KAF5440538.1 ATP-binding cassette domain-containing protein [Pediococcus sp. EKM201D]QHM65376.1 Macrolide export ATP-binding/permease protein MacB [Pediococcus pentosaceus]QHM67095.1 Macrolide export ATP-binding/permease protein MacB [Pediococcus pentosaceus]QHM68751.1 Macrolide export ATP-binding/permease protein MacB [Pediococcus pent